MVGKDRKKSSNKPLQQSTNSRRKKKVQVVQGACVVYRLKEEEILQDLIAIRKAVAAKKRQNACECFNSYRLIAVIANL